MTSPAIPYFHRRRRCQRNARLYTMLFLALLPPLTPSASAATPNAAQKQKELEQVRTRMQSVRKGLEHDITQRSRLTLQLRHTERRIGALSKEIQTLDGRISDTRKQLAGLRTSRASEQEALDQEKADLRRQLLATYMAGREEKLKMLLNQEDPVQLGRMLVYYDYFNRARAERIKRVRAHLERLQQIQTQIQQQLATLGDLKTQRQQTLAQLQKNRDQRRGVLADLNKSISKRGAELRRLKRDEKSLTDLLQSLHQALSDIPSDLEHRTNFAALKGRLAWPIQGRLLNRYGESLGGGLRWQGDLIAASRGDQVHAVSYGRVAFADWLPHFGLVVILDHGNGYMSLYAHNQSIYTQVGDWVEAGAVIASIGDSGGQSEPALYFEIRHGKDALNPGHWCRGALAKR